MRPEPLQWQEEVSPQPQYEGTDDVGIGRSLSEGEKVRIQERLSNPRAKAGGMSAGGQGGWHTRDHRV